MGLFGQVHSVLEEGGGVSKVAAERGAPMMLPRAAASGEGAGRSGEGVGRSGEGAGRSEEGAGRSGEGAERERVNDMALSGEQGGGRLIRRGVTREMTIGHRIPVNKSQQAIQRE